MRTTQTPFRDWPLRARIAERLYRWTHGGQVRTLVVPNRYRARDAARQWWLDHPEEARKAGLSPGGYPLGGGDGQAD